jgi:hypothetical protein
MAVGEVHRLDRGRSPLLPGGGQRCALVIEVRPLMGVPMRPSSETSVDSISLRIGATGARFSSTNMLDR